MRNIARVTVIFLLIAGLFCTVLLNIRYHELVQETELNRNKLQKISRANEELEIRIARTHNLARLEQIAKTKLGMVAPKKVEFIFVDD
ncbi:septum formation initiator family protein [Candidatus Margulisiibacteriota bacterium]